MKKILFILIILWIGFSSQAQSFRIQTSGGIRFDNLFNITEAGQDFSSTITSSSTCYVSVFYNNAFDYIFFPNRPWKIRFEVSDLSSNWDYNRMYIETRRTGNGSVFYGHFAGNTPLIYGYENFTRLRTGNNNELWGRHGLINIPFQFRLRGVSVFQGAGNFRARVTLTVYER